MPARQATRAGVVSLPGLIGLLITAAFGLPGGCDPGQPRTAALSPTQPGQRLWYLAVSAPGQSAPQVDRLIATPILHALGRDERVELIGCRSRPGGAMVFIRSAVSLSSLRVVEDALTRVELPDGTGRASFGAAGPPGLAEQALTTAQLESLLSRGLDAGALLASLAWAPGWLARRRPAARSRFDRAVRIEARGADMLEFRWRQCARQAPKAAGRQPPAGQLLRLDARRLVVYVLLTGSGSAERCERLASDSEYRTCVPLAEMSDAERALLGWPLAATSGLERAGDRG